MNKVRIVMECSVDDTQFEHLYKNLREEGLQYTDQDISIKFAIQEVTILAGPGQY